LRGFCKVGLFNDLQHAAFAVRDDSAGIDPAFLGRDDESHVGFAGFKGGKQFFEGAGLDEFIAGHYEYRPLVAESGKHISPLPGGMAGAQKLRLKREKGIGKSRAYFLDNGPSQVTYD
jgi:hypothetical protein